MVARDIVVCSRRITARVDSCGQSGELYLCHEKNEKTHAVCVVQNIVYAKQVMQLYRRIARIAKRLAEAEAASVSS